jgi:hypothetical protein
VDSYDRELEYVAKLSAILPEGITAVHDGRYRRMLSYKKKNYALLEYDNRIRIKGSSLISRSIEQFGREYIHQCIDCLLNSDVDGLHKLYIQHSIEAYLDGVRGGRRNKSAAYEVAIASGKQYRPGDRVVYYITGTEADVKGFENCKTADDWDPNFPDENTQYYVRRLDEFSEKFAEFFSPVDFRAIFSPEGLFPFDAKGITPLIRDVAAKEVGDEDEPPAPRLGIWLDE